MDTQGRMAEPGGNQPHSSPSRALPVAASACWHCHKCLGLAVFAVLLLSPPTAPPTVGGWAWTPGAVVPTPVVVPDLGMFLSQSLFQPLPQPVPASSSPFTAPATSVTVSVTVPLVCQSLCHSCYHSPFHILSLPLSRLSHPLPASASAQDSAGWPVGHSSHYTAELSLSGRHPADGSCNSRLSGCVGLWEGG